MPKASQQAGACTKKQVACKSWRPHVGVDVCPKSPCWTPPISVDVCPKTTGSVGEEIRQQFKARGRGRGKGEGRGRGGRGQAPGPGEKRGGGGADKARMEWGQLPEDVSFLLFCVFFLSGGGWGDGVKILSR